MEASRITGIIKQNKARLENQLTGVYVQTNLITCHYITTNHSRHTFRKTNQITDITFQPIRAVLRIERPISEQLTTKTTNQHDFKATVAETR